jgi:hypothetical protein
MPADPLLLGIHRAAHFEWRRAAIRAAPAVKPLEIVLGYWEEVGLDTGKAFLRKIDRSRPIGAQIAGLATESSIAMGEDARVVDDGGAPGVRHEACPWREWHERNGCLEEDRPGCDRWWQTLTRVVSEGTGRKITCERVAALPDGDDHCLVRFREE